MAPSAIEIRDLVVDYRAGRKVKRALDGLSLSVARGEIFGFLGPNGAGKTTTIKTLLGLVFPTAGEVSILGKPANDVRSRRHIGYLPEISYFYKFLNVCEILGMYGRIFSMSRRKIAERTAHVIGLVGLVETP